MPRTGIAVGRVVGANGVLVIAELLGFRVPLEVYPSHEGGLTLGSAHLSACRLQWRDRTGLSPASTPRVNKMNDKSRGLTLSTMAHTAMIEFRTVQLPR